MANAPKRVRSLRKTIMYTTLVLFIFIAVIGIYLVIHDEYDEGIWNVSNNIQLITQNITLNQYKLPMDIQTLSQRLGLPTTIDTQTTTKSPLNIHTLEHMDTHKTSMDENIDPITIDPKCNPSAIYTTTHIKYHQRKKPQWSFLNHGKT